MTTAEQGGKAVIVPVRVTGLLLNPKVRATETWERWRPNFGKGAHQSPEPRAPYDSGHEYLPPKHDGVTVSWELPGALRTDREDDGTGFLRVPDRWLVVRYSTHGETQKREAGRAWVVAGDRLRDPGREPGELDNCALYPPKSPGGSHRWLGLVHDLTTGEWKEDSGATKTELTAAGLGLVSFALYQPYNLGVFSLHDQLTDLTDKDKKNYALSYQVIGWYSDPAHDPLAKVTGAQSLATRLQRLQWELAGGSGGVTYTKHTIYSGCLLKVTWEADPKGPPDKYHDERPAIDKANRPDPLKVVLTESSVQGIIALLAHELAKDVKDEAQKEQAKKDLIRFEAFLYGMLNQFDDQAEGPAVVQRLTRRSHFEPVDAGYVWHVEMPPPDVETVSPGADLHWRALLDDLNADQDAYDTLMRELARLQSQYYQLWWAHQEVDRRTRQVPQHQKQLRKKLEELGQMMKSALDCGTLRAAIKERQEEAGRLAERVPEDETGNDVTDLIEAQLEQEAPGARLRRVPRAPFYRPTEPVVLLRGANSERLKTDLVALPCRWSDNLVTKIGDTKSTTPPKPPNFDKLTSLDALKDHPGGLLTGLLTEFALFDTAGAPAVLQEREVPPAVKRATIGWKQPWTPLFLLWQVVYYPVPYNDVRTGHKGERNWTFDKDKYRWKGKGHATDDANPPSITLSGRTFLSPHAVWNVADRAAQEAPYSPDTKQQARLEALAKKAREGDLISQALDGFNEQLLSLVSEARLSPTGALDALVQGNHGYTPYRMETVKSYVPNKKTEDYVEIAAPQQLRGGQFRLTALTVIDRFGRSLQLVPDEHVTFNGKPLRSSTLLPDRCNGDPCSTHKKFTGQLAHLVPRLPQPARLRMDLLTPAADRPVDPYILEPQSCGWVVPNYLDGALLVYGPDGTLLGDLSASGGQIVWECPMPPHDLPSATDHPHLHGFLSGLKGTDGTRLEALNKTIGAIQATLASGAPEPAHPSLQLLGRPLALIRLRLALEADGPPVLTFKDHLTKNTGSPEYLGHGWMVRLGNTSSPRDGLVGFFRDKYTEMHTVRVPPGVSSPYLRQAARPELTLAGEAIILTALVDPWSHIEAVTHLVPAADLRLAPQLVADAVSRMTTFLRVGPALGTTRKNHPKAGSMIAEVPAFPLPVPVLENGEWTWTQGAQDVELTVPDSTAIVTPEFPAHLRTGKLRLTGVFDEQPP
ncbi:hypothetical protein AGRA3207_001429 [Actinomadura graeca]|uniref:Uncharacterized protein n=1 Tax=Actinomadura graeca TaxID=2750812 RepID=A0ABX8QR37_9ACTN|nr:hypothetical protein [Actinomadura graeca]QXJ20674.1 hypothetical protein AGRA3207_001429 [Actinomadura graeca]